MMLRKIVAGLGALLMIGSAFVASSAASAQSDDSSDTSVTEGQKVTQKGSFVIDGKKYTVDVDAKIEPGKVVVGGMNGQVDGTLEASGKITTEATSASKSLNAALAGCSWLNYATVALSGYVYSVDGCSYIGLNESVHYTYGMRVANGSGTCFQGRGYDLQYIGSGLYQRLTTWTGFGCKTKGSDSTGTVTWGEVASVAKMQYKPVGLVGSSGSWK